MPSDPLIYCQAQRDSTIALFKKPHSWLSFLSTLYRYTARNNFSSLCSGYVMPHDDTRHEFDESYSSLLPNYLSSIFLVLKRSLFIR